jgi:hypothetical protein
LAKHLNGLQQALSSRQPSPALPQVFRQYVFAWAAPRTQYGLEKQHPPFSYPV